MDCQYKKYSGTCLTLCSQFFLLHSSQPKVFFIFGEASVRAEEVTYLTRKKVSLPELPKLKTYTQLIVGRYAYL
jgi:hypothetical protein